MLKYILFLSLFILFYGCIDDSSGSCSNGDDCDTEYCDPVKKICSSNPCKDQLCSDHGHCVIDSDGHYGCQCELGYQTDATKLACIIERCVNGSSRALKNSCGLNSQGLQLQICRNELWENSGGCQGDNICTIGEIRYELCQEAGARQKQLCLAGQWQNDGSCSVTCEDGALSTVVCGLNKGGTQKQICNDQEWQDDGACVDSDWVVNNLGNSDDQIRAITSDSQGSIYIAGHTDKENGLGVTDLFVTKYSLDGAVLFHKQLIHLNIQTELIDRAEGIALGKEGDIYITGSRQTNNNQKDILLVKYSPEGEHLWSKSWGDPDDDEWGNGIAIDDNNDILIVGASEGTFGELVEGKKEGADKDILLMKCDPDGKIKWVSRWGTTVDDEGTDIALIPGGDPVITGYTTGPLTNQHFGGKDIIIARFKSYGELDWGNQIGGEQSDTGSAVAVSSEGIFVTSSVYAGIEKNQVILQKFTFDGQAIWNNSKYWGTEQNENVSDMIIDQNGDLLITGTSDGNYFFGDYLGGFFLIKYNEAGEYLGGNQWGSSCVEDHPVITTIGYHQIVIGGSIRGDLLHPVTCTGDIFNTFLFRIENIVITP